MRVLSSAVVVALVGGLFWAATASPGEKAYEARLNDAGVWVSSASLAKFGRFNTPIKQLDAGVSADVPEGSGLDIVQDGAVVVGLAKGSGQLLPIDPKTSGAGSGAPAPPMAPTEPGIFHATPIDLRGGTLAVVEPKTGKVWAERVDPEQPVTDLGQVSPTTKPLATVGADAAITVDVDGNVHAISGRTGKVITLLVAPEGFAKPTTVTTGLRSDNPDLSAVGSTWVALDAEKDTLYTEKTPDGFAAHVSAGGSKGAALQFPSAAADTIAVSSPVGSVLVPLDGGAARGGVTIEDMADRDVKGTLIARPAVLRGCHHAAWAQQGKVYYGANCGRSEPVPTGTIDNVNEIPTREGVAFRINRDAIILNDLDNGSLWDIDERPKKLDNWDSLIPPPKKQDDTQKKDENLVDDQLVNQPPKAVDDAFNVRPGRTSKLHILDNDTDVAGSVLAVDPGDVTPPSVQGITAVVSSDGQTIDVTLPERPDATEFTFDYKVNNGKAKERSLGKVTVRIVAPEVQTAPKLREGAKNLATTSYPVVAGRRLSVPVIADWRDGENDPLSPVAVGEGSMIDGRGQVTLVAPMEPGPASVTYGVADGHGGQTEGSVSINVLDPTGTQMEQPRTQPDVVRGIVGKPVQLEPLGNDIAGADPAEPDAQLTLQAPVQGVGPLQVDTELGTGVVTITGTGAGTFELAYAARTGGGTAPGRIRVDMIAEPGDEPPVAVPDSGTLHDQAPVLVDVLANDYSPRGDVLVTASVGVDGDNSWLRPSIYQGRWVRIEATQPSTAAAGESGRAGQVTYSVSDGVKRTTGQISVVQRPALTGVVPIVVDDTAVVREGDTVTIPVLDNDSMADGIPLKLVQNSVRVINGSDAQRAFASDNVIRYVPEMTGLTAPKVITLEYATYPDGGDSATAQTGRVTVTVNPLPSQAQPNQPPAARSFSASVTSGDPLTITVPTFGIDPDGDSAAVAGIVGQDNGAVELTHGRVVSFGPSTIRYESYPTASGTEIINYEVTDRFGAKSRAFIRVGVVAPGDPQPPVAVQDTVLAAPGKTVTINILRNDLIARGDSVDLEWKDLNDDKTMSLWTVDDKENTVSTVVPDVKEPVRQMKYGIDNGVFDPSRTTVLVQAMPGYENPPVARDDVAKPEPGSAKATVDVLLNDYDIDSKPETLRISEVLSPSARIVGDRVEVDILDHAYSVPYVIKDEDGLPAMALIHVPTGTNGVPFVVQGALITMDKDSTKTVALEDYVKSTRNRKVGITAAETVSASPADKLTAVADGTSGLTLTSQGGYVGPAAVMVEVTDQESLEQKDFGTAYVSIPVQVGPKVPLMRCPDAAIEVSAGGRSRNLDIPTLCRAWLPQGMSVDDLTFESAWGTKPDGTDLEVEGTGGRQVSVRADANAPSGTGTILVKTAGMDKPAEIRVTVLGVGPGGAGANGNSEAAIPPPTLRPMLLTGLAEGTPQTLDVSGYLDSPLENPQCAIQTATVESGTALTVSASGCTLTFTAGTQPSPTASVAVTVSDGPGRLADGRVSVTMLGKPTAPQGVSAAPDRIAGKQATVSWLPPQYNGGSPIQKYVVTWTAGGGGTTDCASSPCLIQGLQNNVDYTFTVAAVNAIGTGPASEPSNVVKPDVKPQAPTNIAMVSRGDGTLTIGWTAAVTEGSPLKSNTVRLSDSNGVAKQVDVAGSATQAVVTGLNNMATQQVSVVATNDVGPGPAGMATQPMQSAGTPPNANPPTIVPRGPSAAADSESLTISWPAVSPNGPGPSTYRLYRSANGGAMVAIKDVGTATTTNDVVAYDGTTYAYAVSATNAAGNESTGRSPSTYVANGKPATPTVTWTPIPDGRPDWMQFNVAVKNPRAAGFSAIRWRSSTGQSGTFTCGCAANTTVAVTVTPTGGNRYDAQTMTVWTVNAAGQVSDPDTTGGTANPYGDTLAPSRPNGSASGTDLHFTWNNRPNGSAIDGVQVQQMNGDMVYDGGAKEQHNYNNIGYSATRNIRVRAHSRAGWGPWSDYGSATTVSPPQPKVTVGKGSTCGERSCNTGNGSCSSASCRWIKVTTSNFNGGVTCHFTKNGNNVSGWTNLGMGGNTTAESNNFLGEPGAVVRATCDGVTDALTW